jgi:solute carrier family 20 (sodium-dependent phosphate transporter)
MISWVASPVFAGTISCLMYTPVKKLVMESENSFERAVHVYPIVVFIGVAGNIFFVLFKFNNIEMSDYDWGRQVVLPASLGGGTLCSVLTFLLLGPYLKARVERLHVEHMEQVAQAAQVRAEKALVKEEAAADENEEVVDVDDDTADKKNDVPTSNVTSFEGHAVLKDPVKATRTQNTVSLHNAWNYFADNTYRQDLKTMSLEENKGAAEIWETSVVYDERTEWMFSYLQIFTACLTSFAHGGNDVANAIAPASAVLAIFKDGELNKKSPVQKWLLAMGGAALSCGFIFFGYRIIKSVGFKLTCITPSRGFCIELATAIAVSLATFMELPVSSTQCLVGATAGVGLASGGWRQVQWLYLGRTMVGWVFFFFMAVIVSAGFFSYSIYSPSFYGISK